jgi:hypothetical protein
MQLRRRRMDRDLGSGPLQGSGHFWDGAIRALYLPRLCTEPRPVGRGRCRLEARLRDRGAPSQALVVSAQHLTRVFGGKVALENVRFEVGAGQLLRCSARSC